MNKLARKITTIVAALVLTVSSTCAVFAATDNIQGKGTTEDMVTANALFYILNPYTDEAVVKGILDQPLKDSLETIWTSTRNDMKGVITYSNSDYKKIPENIKNGSYLDVEDISSVITEGPSDETIAKVLAESFKGYTFDTTKYEIKWFVAKYLGNGFHVDGIVVEKGTESDETEKETTAAPVTEESTAAPVVEESTAAPVVEESTVAPVVKESTTAAGIAIIEDENPLAAGVETTTAAGIAIIDDASPLATSDSTNVMVFVVIAVVAAGVIVAVNGNKKEN